MEQPVLQEVRWRVAQPAEHCVRLALAPFAAEAERDLLVLARMRVVVVATALFEVRRLPELAVPLVWAGYWLGIVALLALPSLLLFVHRLLMNLGPLVESVVVKDAFAHLAMPQQTAVEL